MNHDSLIDALHTCGWYVWDDFLSTEKVRALASCIPEEWTQAGIGRNQDYMQAKSRRRDKIQWLDGNMGQPVQAYLAEMETIRQMVNCHLFLGLFEYESHFAKYEHGDFYEKHLDAFKGQSNRKLTTVFYLNEQWHEDDGGQLKMYDMEDNLLKTLEPKAGRLVVFLSENFPHEVLPVQRERFSIAGWFRTNGVTGDRMDISR